MKVDLIITGQGIAGSMLAWFLLKTGKRIIIIDEFNSGSASHIASGIINPVTGKRLVKSWRFNEIMPFAQKTYQELQHELGVKIFFEKRINRIFSNKEDFQFFRQKNELGELPEYVQPLAKIPDCFRDGSLGGIQIKEAFQVEYPVLLSTLRKFFIERGLLREENFQHQELGITSEAVHYKNIEAAKIIFCEGSQVGINPYFNRLPFNFAKGEILIVSMPGFPEEDIWHKGIFIAPLGDNLFRVGATYEWNFADNSPSLKGKEELTAKLKRAVTLPFEIVQHHAAIRPTVIDRRPLIGVHPEFPPLGIFNGLGTKGASLAPYFAHHFAEHLSKGSPFDHEIDIKRFSAEAFSVQLENASPT